MTEGEYNWVKLEYEKRHPNRKFEDLRLFEMNQYREWLVRDIENAARALPPAAP